MDDFWKNIKGSVEELNKFKNLYTSATLKELKHEYPNVPRYQFNNVAKKVGLKRGVNGSKRCSDLRILLSENLEAYYWIGFIAADGCITNIDQLTISLSLKDLEHLEKFSKYIDGKISKSVHKKNGFNSKNNFIHISSKDSIVIPKLKDKFDLKTKKTYNPPDVKKLKSVLYGDKLLAFIIGFYDGDGSIGRKSKGFGFYLSLTNHHSWGDIHNFFLDYFKSDINYCGNAKVRIKERIFRDGRRGKYSRLELNSNSFLKTLYLKMKSLNIPYMKRKWDKLEGLINE